MRQNDPMDVDGSLLFLVTVGAVGLAVWALADALIRPTAFFPAAGKQTKPFWMAVLAVAAVGTWWFGALSLPGIIAAVASIVYLVDVRPALRQLRSGGSWG
ncbi:MAG: uncharacterized protein JWL64_2646 [Frankiales bacterium]|nr:uncharacterized protein [Frankiales bacterium]